MPNLLGLFYWGACRVRKLGATSNMKGCRVDRIEWENARSASFRLSFVRVCTSTHDSFNAPQSSQNFGGFDAMNGPWVLVHTLTRGKPKMCISHSIRSILKPFILDVPPIYSPCTRPSKTILTNMASIKRQINKLSKDI